MHYPQITPCIFVSPTTYQPGSVTAEVYWLKHAYQEKWASSDFYGIIFNELSRLCVIKFCKLYNFASYKELVFSPIHQGIDSIFWQQWFILILFSTDFYSILLKQDYYMFFIYPNEPKMIIYSTNSRQTILKLTDQ